MSVRYDLNYARSILLKVNFYISGEDDVSPLGKLIPFTQDQLANPHSRLEKPHSEGDLTHDFERRRPGSNCARSAAVRSVALPALHVEVHQANCARNGHLRVAKGKGKDVSGIDLGGD